MRTTHKAVGLLQWLRSSQLSQQHGTESEAVRASGAAALSATAARYGWRGGGRRRTQRQSQELSELFPRAYRAYQSQ